MSTACQDFHQEVFLPTLLCYMDKPSHLLAPIMPSNMLGLCICLAESPLHFCELSSLPRIAQIISSSQDLNTGFFRLQNPPSCFSYTVLLPLPCFRSKRPRPRERQ